MPDFILFKKKAIIYVWFLLAAIAVVTEISRGQGSVNNYLIFKGVFAHTVQQLNLYSFYPNEYNDHNLYGPFFSLIIAPFALLPWYLGCFLWCMCNAAMLYLAVRQLPFGAKQKNILLLIGVLEMMTSIHNVQFNPMLTAWIILSYTHVNKGKDIWATFFIAAGFLVKIYGVVGLLFFLFSKNKIRFVLYFMMWLVVFFCLPMVISSPAFIMHSYLDWFNALVKKDHGNTALQEAGNMQDISVMGLCRRIFHIGNLKNFWVTVPAAILILFPLLRFRQYRFKAYQLTYLVIVLLSVVLFSSSAESPTYVIAVTGVAIWYVLQGTYSNKWFNALLVFVLVLTCLSGTDLFPKPVFRAFVRPYALKALPCFVVWLVAIYQLWRNDFGKHNFEVNAAA